MDEEASSLELEERQQLEVYSFGQLAPKRFEERAHQTEAMTALLSGKTPGMLPVCIRGIPLTLSLILEVLKWIGIGFLVWMLLVEVVFRIVRHYHHFPAPAFVGYFLDSRFRKRIQGTKHVMDALNLRSDMVLLEVGCGPGTFTIDVAKRIEPEGIVHAVDIEPRMIKRLKEKMKRNKVKNVVPHTASAYELPLEDSSIDAALMVAVIAEIPDKVRALHEIRRVLKPNGILSTSEFLLDPDYPRRKTTIKWAEAAGFELVASYGSFYSYTLNFQPKTFGKRSTLRIDE